MRVEAAIPTRTRLYVRYRDGGPSVIRMYTLDGKRLADLPAEPLSEIAIGTRLSGDDVLVQTMSYRSPQAWFRYDAARNRLVATSLNGKSDVTFADAAVVREFAVSKDGTKIPVNIVHRKGLELDGRNPVLLLGYGGYGVSMTPWFNPLLRLWLDYGGVFAVANVRGGGEYGEAVARGRNAHAQAERVRRLRRGHAPAGRTQIHESRAARDHRPLQRRTDDGRRVDAAPAGHARGGERRRHLRCAALGNAAERRVQHHRIRLRQGSRAVQGPLRLLAAVARARRRRLPGGAVDDRRQRRPRRAARIVQDGGAPASGHVIGQADILRTEAAAGHGIGTSLAVRIEEATDEYAFLVDQLGMAAPTRKGVDPRAP